MFYHLVIAILGVLALIVVWLTVQTVARRQSPSAGEQRDVLACRMCSGSGICSCGRGRQD